MRKATAETTVRTIETGEPKKTGETEKKSLAVGILGASGYGGAGLLTRLAQHPQARISAIGSRRFLAQQLAACWPHLADRLDLEFQEDDAVIEASEVLFCATPHGATAPLVKRALDAGLTVIDLSADFRLEPTAYARWYGATHPHPELYPLARYGLSELHRQELYGARLVANPGCNASAAILALAPLAAHQLCGPDVIIDIATGVSGAGRGAGPGTHFSELNENFKPYQVAGTHRHIAEIERTLGRARAWGKQLRTHGEVERPVVTFTPHLAPMTRGILATCYTRPPGEFHAGEGLLDLYRAYYQEDPLITVQEAIPQTKAVSNSDRTLVSVRYDERSHMIISFAALDNLGKGAAGQAVQNFNIVYGFAETTGLRLEGEWP